MKSISKEASRTFRLCIDSYDDQVPEGRLFHPSLETGAFHFHSVIQLVLKIEQLLDDMKFPQSFTAKRSFAPIHSLAPDEPSADAADAGAVGTFVLRLIFRQHTTWQGTVTWVEGRGEQNFRSVLELLLLLDSALGEKVERQPQK